MAGFSYLIKKNTTIWINILILANIYDVILKPELSPCEEAHKALTFAFHMSRSEASRRAVFQDLHPDLFLSTYTIRRHVVVGRSLFLLPSGV